MEQDQMSRTGIANHCLSAVIKPKTRERALGGLTIALLALIMLVGVHCKWYFTGLLPRIVREGWCFLYPLSLIHDTHEITLRTEQPIEGNVS